MPQDDIHDTDRPTEEKPPTRVSRPSRRTFLKAGAALGAGSLLVGYGSTAMGQKVEAICNGEGSISVSDGFSLIGNEWGNPAAEQCIWRNDDGSYGYEFDARNTGGGINYPEVFAGTRPWGSDTGIPEFPIQRGDIDELVIDVAASYSMGNGEWDWAEEWWLLEQPPSQQPETHQYEVMLLLDWGGGHNHGSVQDEAAWTDQFGNTVDLWTTYDSGGTDAYFYIFRIQDGHDGGKIDMTEIVDYLTADGVREDLYVSGIELGSEYWQNAVGEMTYETFDVTINGSTYHSGSDGEPTPTPTATDTPTETNTPTETQTDTEQPGDVLVIDDFDGDPGWSSNRNDLGQWCGAGSFENGSGSVSDGVLLLEYNNGGWFQTQLNRDISDYATLVMRVRGANGGEESDILFDMGGVRTLLATVTDGSIGTTVSDLTVDLTAAGVDRTDPSSSLRLNFWQGGNSTLAIQSIHLS